MAWKATIPWVGTGAAVALGFLWARRTPGSRGALPRVSQGAAPEPVEGRISDISLDPDVNLDERAHTDAIHDMGTLGDNAEFAADSKRDPVDIEAVFDVIETAGPHDHVVPADEPYDALDTEDVGTAWLRRATQADPSEDLDLNDALEGMHEISESDPTLSDLEREAAFGADQSGVTFAPYAGTHDADIATELPVGTLDSAGNAQFYAPLNPPDALEAPPTSTLSPNDDEMARRDAAHAVDRLRSRR